MPTIQVRVTKTQLQEIAHNAQLLGINKSEYGRTVMLNPGVSLDGRLAQEVAATLCQHASLVNQLPPSSTRDDLAKWEGTVWQLLR